MTQNVELGTALLMLYGGILRLSHNHYKSDRIPKGRSMLGIGAGEAQNVVDFGIPFEKPVTKFKEQLEVIEKLFGSTQIIV